MFFADEVRGAKDLENVPVKAKVSAREMQLAQQLIRSQSATWRPAKYKDAYRQRVLKLVRDKAKGKDIAVEPEAEPAAVTDIMEALRASVDAIKRGEKLPDVPMRLRAKRRMAADAAGGAPVTISRRCRRRACSTGRSGRGSPAAPT